MNNNQDIFSLCMADMTASLELVAELETELGNVHSDKSGTDAKPENQNRKKSEPRAWAV